MAMPTDTSFGFFDNNINRELKVVLSVKKGKSIESKISHFAKYQPDYKIHNFIQIEVSQNVNTPNCIHSLPLPTHITNRRKSQKSAIRPRFTLHKIYYPTIF